MIAAVVWLSLVFFSASDGFSKRWSENVVAVLGTVRITPKPAYFESKSFQIDNYSSKSSEHGLYLQQKAKQDTSPYNPEIDSPLPWAEGSFENPAKKLQTLLSSLSPNISYSSFEAATTYLALSIHVPGSPQASVNQLSFLLSLDPMPEQFSMQKQGRDYPVLFPLSFQRTGAKLNDTGFLEYAQVTPTGPKNRNLPIYVAGFYDPGILPIGGKLLITIPEVIERIQPEPQTDSIFPSTGYSVWHPGSTVHLQEIMDAKLKEQKLDTFFKVEPYNRLEFTSDLFQQLESEKNLFRLLSLIIMIVACSNIISLLLILVHSKRQEIAILRALGASKASILTIFVIAGFLIGLIGILLGTATAWLTMQNLNSILAFLGNIQGHEVLAQVFYGTVIPNSLSPSATLFTISSTLIIATISGLLASLSAVRVNVSQALRGEG